MLGKWRAWQYYIIIGVISLVTLFFLPMVGTQLGLSWNIPDTPSGWVVYVTTKLLAAIINILIFHCFIMQGTLNVRDNARYKEAQEILEANQMSQIEPRSPDEWRKETYGKKGTGVFITSALSTIGLTQAILVFDWISLLTYLFTLTLGVIFGILQMSVAEEYWINEYWIYAHKIKRERERMRDDRD